MPIARKEDATYSCFGMVQLHTTGETALCEEAELRDDQLVELSETR